MKYALQYDFNAFGHEDMSSDTTSMRVTPIFGRPHAYRRFPEIFVIMPFAQELEPVFTKVIKATADQIGVSCGRADSLFTASAIIHDVWRCLCTCRIVIADCTGRNPNVFYELGLAHALGKRVVLLTQSRADVPFDIGYIRYIEYETTPEGAVQLSKRLEETLRTELVDHLP